MSTATISAPAALPAPSKASSAASSQSPLDFAVEQILAKKNKQAIVSELSARYFLSSENALAVVQHAYALKHAAFRKAGVKILLTGIVMAILGVGLTVAGESMVHEHGGTYFIFYGLVIMGFVRVVQGLFRIIVG